VVGERGGPDSEERIGIDYRYQAKKQSEISELAGSNLKGSWPRESTKKRSRKERGETH